MTSTLTSSRGLDILVALSTLLFILYKYFTRNFDYWRKRGVPHIKPLPFFGNFFEVFSFRSTIGHFLANLYNKFKTPFFGIYVFNKPYLVIRDPDLIKTILVRDFHIFRDRTVVSDEKLDPVSANFLFLSKSPEWKSMRTKVTPAFTTGRIKNMVSLMNDVADEMKVYLDKNIYKSSIEAKEVCAKYSTDVIASCAFGINGHSFLNENAQFRVMSRKMFEFNLKTGIRQVSYFLAPGLVKLFRMPFLDRSITDFMREAFWATFEEREKSKIKRNDLIDILNQIRSKSSPDDNVKFDGDRVISLAGQFYAAGFETVSTTMAFALYELCLHPNIQNKVRSEITTALSKHQEFNYEALQEMKYLHMVLRETLRMYPVLPFLDRVCEEDYKIPESDFVIEKGTPVYIPMFGLHYDPEYFPDPDKFDPERFSDENSNNIPSFTYIPFGEGPRNCIGARFGLISTKLGLARLLLEYEVVRSEDTPVPIVFDTKGFLIGSTVGLPMKIKKTIRS